MKRFYLINKTPRDKTGKVLSEHETFEAAQAALDRIQAQVDGTVPAVIIESEKRFRRGELVGAGRY